MLFQIKNTVYQARKKTNLNILKLQYQAKQPSKSLVIAAFAAVYIIWGSTYIGIVLAIKTIPPFLMAGIRFFSSGIILYIWCLAKGEKMPDIKSTLNNVLSGTLMLFFGTTSLIWVEQYLPSGLCAIIVAAVPLWFVILDKRNHKKNFSDKFILTGLVIGFIGILILFSGKSAVDLQHNSYQFIAFIVLICSGILWAAGSLFSKYAASAGSTFMKGAIQMLAAGIGGFIAALVAGEQHHFHIQQVSAQSWKALLYLVFMGSIVGYIAYIWLLSVRPASLVGTYAYVNPGVAVFLGWMIAGEVISTMQITGLVIILSGVLLVNFSKYKK